MTTIIDGIKEKQVVKFAKRAGCPKCRFLDMAINATQHGEAIKTIVLEDYTADDFETLGIQGTPVMAVVENGKIVKRDATVLTTDQLNEFMATV